MAADIRIATFAGGCFWCVEHPYSHLAGVVSAVSGYTGGARSNPSYEQVCSGATGHVEAVQISFDPEKTSYAELLDTFWRQIDPTDAGGQFADRGSQYRPVIFYHDAEQKRQAETSRDALVESGRFDAPIVVAIEPAQPFYPAEDYHQGYADKHPAHYCSYRAGSGRQAFLARVWGE